MSLLYYDRRKRGSGGTALRCDVPELGLLRGDRLEPTEWLPDTADFKHVGVFPFTAVFWRTAREDLCKRRCPLWSRTLGLTLAKTIALDLLHAFFLGPVHIFSRNVVWLLLRANVWGRFEASAEDSFMVAVQCMKGELFAWYERRRRSHPQERLTEVSDLTPNMLGTRAEPKLKLKAMECWGMFLFLLYFIEAHAARIGDRISAYLRVGKLLERFYVVLKAHGHVLPAPVRQDRWGEIENSAPEGPHKSHTQNK